jgi:uncharacterized membrane protein
MDDLAVARALHVLAIVHWIGGVAMVTWLILPAIGQLAEPARRLALFDAVEGRFGRQARWSVSLTGLTGLYLTYRLDAWDRFLDPAFWWMHAMVLLWAIFAIILFVAEPLVLHDWFRREARVAPERVMRRVQRAHHLLLILAMVTIAGAVLGAHGALLW